MKDSSTLRNGHFSTFAYISAETGRIFMEILSQIYTRTFSTNVGTRLDPDFGYLTSDTQHFRTSLLIDFDRVLNIQNHVITFDPDLNFG